MPGSVVRPRQAESLDLGASGGQSPTQFHGIRLLKVGQADFSGDLMRVLERVCELGKPAGAFGNTHVFGHSDHSQTSNFGQQPTLDAKSSAAASHCLRFEAEIV